jgi:hypothetical protein
MPAARTTKAVGGKSKRMASTAAMALRLRLTACNECATASTEHTDDHKRS